MRIACIGTGEIGASWVALFMTGTHEVTAWDPAPGWQDRLVAALDRYEPQLQELHLPIVRTRLRLCATLAEAVAEAELIQENAPEQIDLKRALVREIASLAPLDSIIASSTSGLLPGDIARDIPNPGRLLVAHPFSPPHLVPAMEIVGTPEMPRERLEAAVELYRSIGRQPIVVSQAIPGFIGNRLQAAMFREAFHMIAADEATMEEIDSIIKSGPGLRYGISGPCEAQLGWVDRPEAPGEINEEKWSILMDSDWSRLPGPPLTNALRDLLVRNSWQRTQRGSPTTHGRSG
ncbi:3-hydroxyacyl-CoA dehydrogenase NAD-binding domain-containing protein (plasmid) [Sinorhizobium numidicum]|uniref:3-hydroxyacyl-CoA dehydrogenase NAD-binding domain-containing protein n=1 Tax=Sinorhizobium numidicum TaxID=680248 RepID=A0ABY8D730_9HYPH|nr:3-hydroxyacyl-CoA dehydrogenase NAD-binding domain-containing protein [Sinorhizobium numidicum]WEX79687.1 3-hydroxyacyl-CoA dehydrogenase NAD-binding domain-containing protein [Sinorhizobium numidicum]WEX85360.1 3-hydroxyacyl-CoA dehydrogenase NAD-binding domain-containing protein [Sinorhizobium numidicum]